MFVHLRKRALVLTAAALAVAGIAVPAAVTSVPARAATPSCGPTCVEPFSHEWGRRLIMDAIGNGFGRQHQRLILFRASHDDGAQDFVPTFQGPVSGLVGSGLLAPTTLIHYAADQAFELEYSPFGVDSGFCVGTWPQTPNSFGRQPQVPSGFKLRLEPCGEGSNTIWIVDHFGTDGNDPGFGTVISGTTTNFSHPPVWTYPALATPFDFPRPSVIVSSQRTFSSGQHPDSQQWGARVGVIP